MVVLFLQSMMIIYTVRSVSLWLSLLKWAATSDSSVQPCVISKWWPVILHWWGWLVSPTYWRPHLLYCIKWIRLEDSQSCHASCNTFNVIHLIQCRRCSLQYVGKTGQPVQCTMNGRCFNIMHDCTEESPVATHFDGDGHTEADLTTMTINRLGRNDTAMRKIRESWWIRSLGSSWPKGMNLQMGKLWSTYTTSQSPTTGLCPTHQKRDVKP